MIGAKGTVYQVEWATTDPRSKHVEWSHWSGTYYPDRQTARKEANRLRREGTLRVRVIKVTQEIVWASDEALVAVGATV